jgi:hypothetical protein
MNSDRINSWMRLGANLGVLAGIIVLAVELQQNTVATELEAVSNFQNTFSEIELFVAGNPEFAELLVKGRESEELTATDRLRLSIFYGNILFSWQYTHFQYQAGALDEDIWQGTRVKWTRIISADDGLLNHWQRNKREFSPAFKAMVESMIGGSG